MSRRIVGGGGGYFGLLHLAHSLALVSCGGAGEALLTGPGLSVAVAPLNLPEIDFSCYDLRVDNGAGQPVVRRGDPALRLDQGDSGTLCSTRFGNGAGGDISYVAPCDAQEPGHTVTLWLDGLYTGTQASPVLLDDYQDPCPTGCALQATCQENADTPVTFNITVMRRAQQGFFDIGVNFDNIFCSAKVDCLTDDGQPLTLVHHPETGLRGQTAVLGLACTAGPGAEGTVLLRDPITITCGTDVYTLDPAQPEGNVYTPAAGPNPAPTGSPVWQYAVYAGEEALDCGGEPCNKVYWNVAIGFDPLAEGCTLTTAATAGTPTSLPEFTTPEAATWPIIEADVDLTFPDGGLACRTHPLNGAPVGVATRYTTVDVSWTGCHRLTADGPSTRAGPDCGATEPTTTIIGDSYPGTRKWLGGALAPNGAIYLAPVNASQVLKIAPDEGDTTSLVGAAYPGSDKWFGGVLAPNGRIYFAPVFANQVLRLDPVDDTTQLVGSSYSGQWKYCGAVLGANGIVYFTPSTANRFLALDPADESTTPVGPDLGTQVGKWCGGVLGTDGWIHVPPVFNERAIRFNPQTGVVETYDPAIDPGESVQRFYGTALSQSGDIFLAPFDTARLARLPLGVMELMPAGDPISELAKWAGAVPGRNGMAYFVPFSASNVLQVNPADGSMSSVGSADMSLGKWFGGIMHTNGSIYFVPFNAPSVMKLSNVAAPDVMGASAVLPADVSTLPTSAYNRHYNNL